MRIRPSAGLNGSVLLPGDKSLSHRAILIASLAQGTSRIGNCLVAGVTEAMIESLRALGVSITSEPCANGGSSAAADLIIEGRNLREFEPPTEPLNCRGSATTMRLLAGVLAAQNFESTLDGNARLRQRPMDRVVNPLCAKGAVIETDEGCAPLRFFPASLTPSEHELTVASAQVKSALLLAGLYTDGPTTVVEPHTSRDHTERMLRGLGVTLREDHDARGRHVVTVERGISVLPPLSITLPSDPSSAAFLVVAGLLARDSEVTIPNVCLNPGRAGLFNVLRKMGGDVTVWDEATQNDEPTGTLRIRSSVLRGAEVRGSTVTSMIDEFPVFAVAAIQAAGRTIVRDAAELRVKESDRIQALVEELNRMGAGIEPREDGFDVVGPVKLKGARVNGRGDHRLAMSLAIAGLVADGETIIDGWEAIHDSFPEFPQVLRNLGADAQW